MSAQFLIDSYDRIEDLIRSKVPEGPSLEYKETLSLEGRDERREALKDLTGMGNGGGGSVIYGVREDETHEGVPESVALLSDRTLLGVLENVVRSSVRPPLLVTYRPLEADSGFVLVVEVLRSPLGPYMVEAYDEARFYTRIGTRTVPMSEQDVRDAYALALRAREHRQEVWEGHHLPARPESSAPWLITSALPEEPLTEIVDIRSTHPEEFYRPDHLRIQAELGYFERATASTSLHIWSDGISGNDGDERHDPTSFFRLHRDGAAAIGHAFDRRLPHYRVSRSLNAQIDYLTWIWEKVGLRPPVELTARLVNLEGTTIAADPAGTEILEPRRPLGVPVGSVDLTREYLPWEIVRASVRHAFVRDFSDRFYQAFGLMRAQLMFRNGWLYGPDGVSLSISVAGRGLWNESGLQRAYVYDGGAIRHYTRNHVVAYLVDGVILDEDGRAMATLEMAPSNALPDDFRLSRPPTGPSYVVQDGIAGSPVEETEDAIPPQPQGVWSSESLVDRLSD